MNILINEKVYNNLTDEQVDFVLQAAHKLCSPPCIYAVEKDGLIELQNRTYRSKLAYRSSVKAFERNGFTVYGREG